MRGPVVVIGDAVLDRDVEGSAERLAPDAPVPVLDEEHESARPGGAALAATMAAENGAPVVLVTALGADRAGRELARLLGAAGVDVLDLHLEGPTPEKVRLLAGGRPLLRLDRGGSGGTVGPADDRARHLVATAGAVLVADYGRGVPDHPSLRAALIGRSRRTPLVWDPHPRGRAPVVGVTVATPNRVEVLRLGGTSATQAGGGRDLACVVEAARRLRQAWQASSVAVTLGGDGALLVDGGGPPLAVPADPVAGSADTCGAGDRFAAAVTVALGQGGLPSEAVVGGVAAASAFVSSGGALAYARLHDRAPAGGGGGGGGGGARAGETDAIAVARRVRAAGGTVVATGGCFDLLHAGHVALLRAARRLGDCLVVCLNSDDSVRRLKGAGRPLVPEADRAAVLLALDCVDAVAVFGEDTPDAVLDRLRPHVFAKGGDYAGAALPESDTMARWAGETVVLPYLAGRSTTGLVTRARTGGPGTSAPRAGGPGRRPVGR